MKKILSLFILVLFSGIAIGQNQNLSNGVVFDGEPYLAINPSNAQHMVVAWMGWKLYSRIVIKTKTSFDGGKTWSSATNLAHDVLSYTSADPSIEFDQNGDVFISFIDFTGYNINPLDGAIYVCKSTDGGLNWGSPVEVISINDDVNKKAIDRPWISIDRTNGTIYITSMNAKGATAPYNPYLSVSIDGGSTFLPWRYLDTINWLAGSHIVQPMPTNCIATNGIFYAVYPSYVASQNMYAQFILASSNNAGNSMNYHTVFQTISGISDSLAKSGYLLRSDPNDANHLAFFYLDDSLGDLDVFMRESFNAGAQWSSAIRINDDAVSNNRMQDMLWADFDMDGDLVVTWRDRRNAFGSGYETSYEFYGAFRDNDSTNFSTNFPISDSPIAYDSLLRSSGNDFMCVKLNNDTLYSVWGDTRNGKLNIWFQQNSKDGTLVSMKNLTQEESFKIILYPNPVNSILTVEAKDIKLIAIFDMLGKNVYTKRYLVPKMKVSLELSSLEKGNYIIQCETRDGLLMEKFNR